MTRAPLTRDPADWAREWGWVSRRRAINLAAKIDNVADAIDGSLSDDAGAAVWVRELRKISKQIAPATLPQIRRAPRSPFAEDDS